MEDMPRFAEMMVPSAFVIRQEELFILSSARKIIASKTLHTINNRRGTFSLWWVFRVSLPLLKIKNVLYV